MANQPADHPEQPPPSDQAPASDQELAPGTEVSPHQIQPTSDPEPPSDRAQAPSAKQPEQGAAASEMDEQLDAMLKDNDDRLWYITRYGADKFPEPELKILIDVRRKFRQDPDFQLTCDEEVQYRKATMLASEFLQNRRPEAIRLYADVQEGATANPLRRWLWWIGVVLVFALFSNGYQSLIGIQVDRMKQHRISYLAEAAELSKAAGLSKSTEDLTARFAKMCEQRLVYNAAASQLRIMLPSFPWETKSDGITAPPEVCTFFKNIQPGPETVTHIQKAKEAAFAPSKQQPVRHKAELYDNVLALVILPMLYALLGALTSAVRTANERFKSMTLTQIDSINMGARILLGLVGGATIGIVFSTDTLDGATGLTVIGMAFAVGYAVDLFFNLLDAIKVGLGGSTESKSQVR